MITAGSLPFLIVEGRLPPMAVIKIRLIEKDCLGIAMAQMVRKRPERAGRVLSADGNL